MKAYPGVDVEKFTDGREGRGVYCASCKTLGARVGYAISSTRTGRNGQTSRDTCFVCVDCGDDEAKMDSVIATHCPDNSHLAIYHCEKCGIGFVRLAAKKRHFDEKHRI